MKYQDDMRDLRHMPHLVEQCPLFACHECQTVENVACTVGYYSNMQAGQPVLCSECAEGRWHGIFSKLHLNATNYVVIEQRILVDSKGKRLLGYPQAKRLPAPVVILPRIPRRIPAPARVEAQEIWRSLYVVLANGLVKIGIAADVKKRVSSLRTGNPHIDDAFYSGPQSLQAVQMEKAVHLELAEFRVRGEWFSCTPEVAVAAIKLREERITPRPEAET